MISLDQQIANPDSRAAQRMMTYGEEHEIFILIPGDEYKAPFSLSKRVTVEVVGGSKIQQYLALRRRGKELMAKFDIKFITTQDPFFTGFIGCYLRRVRRKHLKTKEEKMKVKLEVQLHGDFYSSDYFRKDAGFKASIQYWLGRWWVLKRADKIRVVSKRIKKSLIEIGLPKINKIRVRPIFNTLNTSEYSNRSSLKQRYSFEKVFLWMGRMEVIKNLDFLIEVFADVVEEKPTWGLVLVGEGSLRDDLKEQVDSLDLEFNVRFEPWVQNPINHFKEADYFLFPSVSEGYGLVVKEALAVGLPIIMNDVGVARYEVKAGPKVKILPINDKDAWIQAILSI